MRQTKNCITCGKLFEKKINCSKRNWELSRYCSHKCLHTRPVSPMKGKTWEMSEEQKERLRKVLKGKTCNTGRTHFRKGSSSSPSTQFKKGHVTWSKGKKLPYCTGPLNNKWKGGIYPEHLKARHSPEIKQWRKDVFERDNYTCTECGRKRKVGDRVILEADHIKPFAKYPELRLVLSNGRTLCRECHLKMPTHGRNL